MSGVAAAREQPKSRDDLIVELRGVGWSYSAIAREVGMTREGVSRAVARLERGVQIVDAIDDAEAAILAELGELHVKVEAKRSRMAVLRRQLKVIAEEREARVIDLLNGLVRQEGPERRTGGG